MKEEPITQEQELEHLLAYMDAEINKHEEFMIQNNGVSVVLYNFIHNSLADYRYKRQKIQQILASLRPHKKPTIETAEEAHSLISRLKKLKKYFKKYVDYIPQGSQMPPEHAGYFSEFSWLQNKKIAQDLPKFQVIDDMFEVFHQNRPPRMRHRRKEFEQASSLIKHASSPTKNAIIKLKMGHSQTVHLQGTVSIQFEDDN